MELAIIVAVSSNHAIGRNNQLLFHLPLDMKHFKNLTTGHTVIMGRKTFESLPKGALPNRRNIVLTRDASLHFEGTECFDSIDRALQTCNDNDKVFIIGGEQVYRATIDKVNKIYLTKVDAIVDDADSFFPEIDENLWIKENSEAHSIDEKHRYSYCFIDLRRKA
jgi:dihydrofolate reductase